MINTRLWYLDIAALSCGGDVPAHQHRTPQVAHSRPRRPGAHRGDREPPQCVRPRITLGSRKVTMVLSFSCDSRVNPGVNIEREKAISF